MWTGRRKATRGFLTASVAALTVPAIIVGWLGWLLLQSDREQAYKAVVTKAGPKQRDLAAKAMLQMARTYEKLGQPEARATYQTIVRDYRDQPAVVAAARARLSPSAAGAQDVAPRRLFDGGTTEISGISADGRVAVGVDFKDAGGADIVLRDVALGRVTTLVAGSSSGGGRLPRISNDGRRVAYEWVADGQRSLRIIGTEAGATPEVIMAAQPTNRLPLGWSPDGKRILARVETASSPTAAGDRALIFPGLSASWSRDGRLAFFRERPALEPASDLIIREVTTGQERSYRRAGLMTTGSPLWLNDGSGVIVVVTEQDSGSSVEAFYRLDARSGTFQRLFARDANGRARSAVGAISLDDKTLYLTVRNSAGTATTDIVGVDVATARERPVFSFGGTGLPSNDSPGLAVSPDGATLAVLAWREAGVQPRQARIFSVGIDGSNYRDVVGSFGGPGRARDRMRWTPDGHTLVFVAQYPGNNWRLMRVPAAGGQPEFDGLDVERLSPLLSGVRMAPGSANIPDLDLSPDGSRAVLSTRTLRTYELWTLDNLLSVVKSG